MGYDPYFLTKLSLELDTIPNDADKTKSRFEATTRQIRVSVKAFWLEDQSNPEEMQFIWAYHIRVENHGSDRVQLLGRSWEIIDGNGHTEYVQGEGVVGEQPALEPGIAFEYTSSTSLKTSSGFMKGRYHMINLVSNEVFDISIPTFSLDSPYQPRLIH